MAADDHIDVEFPGFIVESLLIAPRDDLMAVQQPHFITFDFDDLNGLINTFSSGNSKLSYSKSPLTICTDGASVLIQSWVSLLPRLP